MAPHIAFSRSSLIAACYPLHNSPIIHDQDYRLKSSHHQPSTLIAIVIRIIAMVIHITKALCIGMVFGNAKEFTGLDTL